MTEPITFKTITKGTNSITVTDTDCENKAPVAGVNSVMKFDKNDKVKVTGDVSVFTPSEIKDAFFGDYDANDAREIKDLSKTDLKIKDSKISGDTTKEFRLEDMAKTANVTVPATTPATSANIPSSALGFNQNNISSPEMAMMMANLTNEVTNFLGYPLSSNYGQPIVPFNNQVSIQDLAKHVFTTVLAKIQGQSTSPSATVNTAAKNTSAATTANATETQASTFTTTTGTITEPTSATTTEPKSESKAELITTTTAGSSAGTSTAVTTGAPADKLVVAEGAEKEKAADETSKKSTAEIKAKAKAKVKAESKTHTENEVRNNEIVGKNAAGQIIKKYNDKNGNRIVETYNAKNQLTQKDIYFAKDDFERRETKQFSTIKNSTFHRGEKVFTDNNGNRVKKWLDKNGIGVLETYKDGKMSQVVLTYKDGSKETVKAGEFAKHYKEQTSRSSIDRMFRGLDKINMS